MEEQEENYLRLQRDFKEKSRNFEQLKRDNEKLRFDFKCFKDALEERDQLIKKADLVIIRNNDGKKILSKLCRSKLVNGGIETKSNLLNSDETNGEQNDEQETNQNQQPVLLTDSISLISKEAAEMLSEIEGESLESKLSEILSERKSMQNQINSLKNDLENERNRIDSLTDSLAASSSNLSSDKQAEIQREANKMTNELRYKLKKSEQDNIALNSTIARLETQLTRLKSEAQEAERVEEELKLDKRKIQRELREALTKIEELESSNSHLQKRIDKLKSNRGMFGAASQSSNSNTPPIDSVPNSILIPSSSRYSESQSPTPSSYSDVSSTLCSTSTSISNE
ncbi:hypothetical protein SSS_02260 [Sarcoptes scabiei]|nr:hypothetical protein SSS_02260 [Sarcoptes scabiei]